MAQSSWSGFPDEALSPDDEYRVTEIRPRTNRNSADTSKSRRESYYDTQRGADGPAVPSVGQKSRPTSTASVLTTRSKGKQRASYAEPWEQEYTSDAAYPHPVPTFDDRPSTWGDAPRGEDRQPQPDATGMHVRNFSRISTRRATSETDREAQFPSDVSALPPLPAPTPKSNRLSAATTARPTTQPTKRSGDFDHGNDAPDMPRPFSQRQPEEYARPVETESRWLTEIYTISYLIFFAIFGTLARLGVQWITFYPGAPLVTPVAWANMAGSWFMGFLTEDRMLFRSHAMSTSSQSEKETGMEQLETKEFTRRKKAIPLYIGLATGFCGSFTSFSSFARDFFLALSNNLPAPIYHEGALALRDTPSSTIGRNAGYSFEAVVGVMFSTVALSLGGFYVGTHTASALDKITPSLPVHVIRKILDPAFVVLGWGCWVGAIIMAALPPDRPGGPASRGSWDNETWRGEVIFALVFAPVGTILRYYISLHMNGLIKWFPLGTFAVNMFGSAVEGMCYNIQHVGVGVMGQIGGGRIGCQVLQGIMDGFCGCLTTVSTWVAEISALKRKHGYLYALASLAGGLCLMVIIMGSVRWTVGFAEPVCSTGYPNKVHG